ncbi:uncharacterized protein FRV6_12997 [Fusarium oxysporum]|uniref:Uncharacterized protein n=1 Tax=Fusarium oxysporum TaxID=5507 RepID=A0A2H3U446_FUSOX|nr:uncharacterized protein FRV6_12997 [Fusarium oxysporum]
MYQENGAWEIRMLMIAGTIMGCTP